MEQLPDYQRAKKAFELALERYDPSDLASEARLYDAAKGLKSRNHYKLTDASRIKGRIAKRRWRRDKGDIASLLEYLTYLYGFAQRRIENDRPAAARSCLRVASILDELAPRPTEQSCVNLMHAICQTAVFQHLATNELALAKAAARQSLRYARAFALWDRTRTPATLLPLRLMSKTAFSNGDFEEVVECQKEVIGIETQYGPPEDQEKRFTLDETQSPLGEAVLRFGSLANMQRTSYFELSRSDRDAAMAFAYGIPRARRLGDEYRLLAHAYAALGQVQPALSALDSAIGVLKSDLASTSNRVLALDIAVEAIELSDRSGNTTECKVRAREAIIESEALKARGVAVPQHQYLLDALRR